jgi:hypothetical protein
MSDVTDRAIELHGDVHLVFVIGDFHDIDQATWSHCSELGKGDVRQEQGQQSDRRSPVPHANV